MASALTPRVPSEEIRVARAPSTGTPRGLKTRTCNPPDHRLKGNDPDIRRTARNGWDRCRNAIRDHASSNDAREDLNVTKSGWDIRHGKGAAESRGLNEAVEGDDRRPFHRSTGGIRNAADNRRRRIEGCRIQTELDFIAINDAITVRIRIKRVR